MYSYEIYPFETGFGFNILQDENIIVHQDYNPDLGGYVLMDEETANKYGAELLARVVVRIGFST